MDNPAAAAAFDELADLLELRGESAFKVRAYRAFADAVRELGEPLDAIVDRRGLSEVRGVGRGIAGAVHELVDTGTFASLERERAAIPTTLRDLLHVSGLGLKSVRSLCEEGVQSLGDLLDACERGQVERMPHFGAKKQERSSQAARRLLGRPPGRVLADAWASGRLLTEALQRRGATAVAVGETRRGAEIVRDLLVVAKGVSSSEALEALRHESNVSLQRPGIISLHLARGALARVRVVPEQHWVQSLLVETGPPSHVRLLEERAAPHGGLTAVCERVATEDELYGALGLPFVPPELRGATIVSADGLVGLADLGGVFHVHTTWSDGCSSLEDMIAAARRAGFAYVGISEHSKAASYAGGLDGARLREQGAAVARARDGAGTIAVLHGVEVDILADGSLDLDDEVLAELDFVIASVHSDHDMPAAEMTARIVRAVSHPLVTILGHPTGRLLLAKAPFEFDLEAVARAAAENDTYLEINANAQRLDLAPAMIRVAHAAGARFAINPDAHEPEGFGHVPFGVTTARRAGLHACDVLNACDAVQIVERLRARKGRAIERLHA